MKTRHSLTYYIYDKNEYALGSYASGKIPNTKYHFISFDEHEYPSIILSMSEINFAYRNVVKIKTNDCEVILREIVGETVIVRMPPGSPGVKKLNAYEAEGGGWYEARISQKDISSIWEEHYPVDGFEFPPYLDFIGAVEI